MPMRSARAALLALLSIALAVLLPVRSAMTPRLPKREVNVYSYRQPYLIDPLFKKFTEETGIKVNVIYAEKGLIERMAAEGRNSPADVLLTIGCRQSDPGEGRRHRPVSRTRRSSRRKSRRPIATKTASGGGSPAAPASSMPRRTG